MGIGTPKIWMKQQIALHTTDFDIEEYCSRKEPHQLQHELRLIFPQFIPGEREVVHRVISHNHQKHLMLWVND